MLHNIAPVYMLRNVDILFLIEELQRAIFLSLSLSLSLCDSFCVHIFLVACNLSVRIYGPFLTEQNARSIIDLFHYQKVLLHVSPLLSKIPSYIEQRIHLCWRYARSTSAPVIQC